MKYRRPYHNSKETSEAIEAVLPSWMKLVSDEESIGWQMFNAFYGIEAELLEDTRARSKDNLALLTFNPMSPGIVYKTQHDVDMGLAITCTANGSIEVVEADDLYTFFEGPPTRIEETGSYLNLIDEAISGLCYCIDYDEDGEWVMRDGELHSVLVVNRGNLYSDYSLPSTTIIDFTTLTELTTSDFHRRTQSYTVTNQDEVVNFIDGEYIMRHDTISTSVKVKDILNLDPSGEATEIASSNFTVRDKCLLLNDYNPVTNPNPLPSTYIVEYDYPVASSVGPVTTGRDLWGVARWNQQIYTAGKQRPYDDGQPIPFEVASSPAVNDVALRIDSTIVRPGATGYVDIEYMHAATNVTITNDEVYDFEAHDANFVSFEESMITAVYKGTYPSVEEVTDYEVHVFGRNGHRFSVSSSTDTITAVALTYLMKQRKNVTSKQSLSELGVGSDEYPYDFRVDNGVLYPYTIVDLNATGSADTVARTGQLNRMKVYFPPDFMGVTINPNDGNIWMIDRNNQRVYIFEGGSMRLLEKKDLFLWDGNTVATIPSTGNYDDALTFRNMKKDPAKIAGPAVIFKDWLFLADRGTLYRINIFDPDLAVSDSYTCPEGVTDITVDERGRFLFSIGNDVFIYQPLWDYMMIDRVNGTIYYREPYSYVEVGGVSDG